MGLDIFANIIVGRKIEEINRKELKNFVERELETKIRDNELDDVLSDLDEIGEDVLEIITNDEGTPEYVGMQLGGDWWGVYELDSKMEREIASAKVAFMDRFSIEPKVYISAGMSI